MPLRFPPRFTRQHPVPGGRGVEVALVFINARISGLVHMSQVPVEGSGARLQYLQDLAICSDSVRIAANATTKPHHPASLRITAYPIQEPVENNLEIVNILPGKCGRRRRLMPITRVRVLQVQ